MKARNLTSIAISTALISSALISPAVANGTTVLPFNANANENSGVHIQACEEYLQISLPSTMADDPHDGNPFLSDSVPPQPYELFYTEQQWNIDNGSGTTALSSLVSLSGIKQPSSATVIEFNSNQTEGSSIAVSLASIGSVGFTDEQQSSFEISNIQVQSTSALNGDGTETDPYLISDSEDLDLMRCDLDAHYKLISDIDMAGVSWMPIGLSSALAFSGVIDGNGKTISNLNIKTVSEEASFLGRTRSAQLTDLTFDSPMVSGTRNVAVVSSESAGSIFENITIENMDISALSRVGGLIAETNRGTQIRNIDISGDIDVHMVYSRKGRISFSPSSSESQSPLGEIGLLVGYFNGQGDSIWKVKSSGTINIAPLIEGDGVAELIVDDPNVLEVGLAIGENLGHGGIFDSNISGSINVDFRGGNAESIGGVYGSSEEGGTLYNSEVNADIKLRAQQRGNGSTDVSLIRDIGVLLGNNKENNYFSQNNIEGTLEITADDPSRDSDNVDVREIGALGGQLKGNSIVALDSEVSIASEFIADRVGLATGLINGDANISNSVFKGSIDVPNDSTNVAGLAGEHVSDDLSLRNVIISGEVPAGFQSVISNNTADANSKIGSARGVFFDSDLNDADPGEFTSGPAGRSATTEQLKSKSFLEANGYDFENDWFEVSGEYPTPIKPSSDSSSTATSAPAPSPTFSSAPAPAAVIVDSVGNAELGPNGGVITITGKSLTGVRLSLGETPLFVQLLSDTEALVQIPAGLAPGSYDLTATGANGVLTSQDVFSITDLTTTSDTGFWTTRNGDNVKIYAKNIIGSGKVQFFVNGEEIAWVNATDNSDEKLRVINEGPMAGNVYLVRDKDLLAGKNVFEIYVDGERVERRIASK